MISLRSGVTTETWLGTLYSIHSQAEHAADHGHEINYVSTLSALYYASLHLHSTLLLEVGSLWRLSGDLHQRGQA